MTYYEYAIFAGFGTLVMGAAAFPLLAALVVACWPGRRPSKKFAFVITSAVVVLGVAGLLSFLALPFELFGTYISPQLEHDGYRALPQAVYWLVRITTGFAYLVLVIGSLVVPIVMRRQLWLRLCEAIGDGTLRPGGDQERSPP